MPMLCNFCSARPCDGAPLLWQGMSQEQSKVSAQTARLPLCSVALGSAHHLLRGFFNRLALLHDDTGMWCAYTKTDQLLRRAARREQRPRPAGPGRNAAPCTEREDAAAPGATCRAGAR